MRVVLRGNVEGFGRRGDIVEVSDGYGRNYLIPKGLAMRATEGSEREAETMRRVELAREAKTIEAAQEIAAKVGALPLTIAARTADEGRLFGSVGVSEILEACAAAGIELERSSVKLDEPIKEIGDHSVTVSLHPEVQVALSVSVVAVED